MQHNQLFCSNDCTSKLIKKCFNSCARTKTESGILNVFEPYFVNLMETNLFKVHYVTIYSDRSNQDNVKQLCSILIKYFKELKSKLNERKH